MNKLELFIKERGIKLGDIEKALGLPHRCLQLTSRDIPKKYRGKIVKYLKEEHEFDGENLDVEVDEPLSQPKVVKVKRWNDGFVPKYNDGIMRYRDPDNGLWKRLYDWHKKKDKETGKIILPKDFEPCDGRVKEDEIGKYYVANNGIKVYSFKKK